MGDLLLIRHGETEWSRQGRHTGSTDLPLTRYGEAQAHALAGALTVLEPARVLVSPLRRAVRTAQLAGFSDLRIEPDLREWDYGGYEGVTTADIRRARPGWDLWTEGVLPGDHRHPGESPAEVAARCDRVLAGIAPLLDGGTAEAGGAVVLVSHGHLLRVLTARYLGLPAADGALFTMATAALCRLGADRGRRVVLGWNLPTRPVR
ncbi:histidine phosphatase family protein [Kitasatospora sp. NPDC089797]|uniref:histidine phosphatase family protein n=1 Tax=Kitasatospora sp. NPDC089797 TaxID=3155298 RepID=UPI003440593B